ncbi:TatD family hydrolase [Fluviicola chungangensis]|uniref:TatD family deoxyribonuclease n=1 Tax=Fluviicola chungangensis TaxID=2597671 RepID=A0A556N107_9FLAO|nr:TatD family hydrolase [Fluviicola chungangensis]TSJ45867.1 TatD family deoxyribonuclease [Fluviicola chungangensis]
MSDLENLFDLHSHHFDSKNRAIVQLTELYPKKLPAFFSFGVHPQEIEFDLSRIEETSLKLNETSGFLAIGEIGLDSRFDHFQRQEELYIFQLKLAARLNKPIILHCVNSWDRCRFLHEKYAPENVLIYHGFNKSSITDLVLRYSKSMISIGETVLSNQALRSCVSQIPVDRLFLETDTGRGELIDTYRTVAEIKKLSLHSLIDQLDQNAKRIFNYE